MKEYEGHLDEQDTEAGETDDDDNELDSGDGGSKVMPGWEGFAGMGGSAQQMRIMMRESQNRFRSQGMGVSKGKGKGKAGMEAWVAISEQARTGPCTEAWVESGRRLSDGFIRPHYLIIVCQEAWSLTHRPSNL